MLQCGGGGSGVVLCGRSFSYFRLELKTDERLFDKAEDYTRAWDNVCVYPPRTRPLSVVSGLRKSVTVLRACIPPPAFSC